MKILKPHDWPRPSGYANGIAVSGELVFVAGMIGWDTDGRFADGFVAQLRQILENTVAVLAEGGARPEHIVRMTWYVKDMAAYRNNGREIGRVYRDVIGKNFPTMAAVGVTELVEARALLEIETTAVIPV